MKTLVKGLVRQPGSTPVADAGPSAPPEAEEPRPLIAGLSSRGRRGPTTRGTSPRPAPHAGPRRAFGWVQMDMATIGALSGLPPWEPGKGAVPKAKMPPSEATS